MDKQHYNDLIQYLETLTHQNDDDDKRKTHIRKDSTHYFIKNHILYRRTKEGGKRVILKEQVEPILYHLHQDMSGAHLGIDAVLEKVRERYYWPQIYKDVREYIRSCDTCQRRGPPIRREELIPLQIREPFHRIGIDIKGPLPRTKEGNRYIIVAIDYFTKWPEARAIPDIKAETVAEFIYKEIICRHGVPKEILSDRGTSFVNQVIDKLCENYQTKHRLTSSYRPQTNGMVERFNRTLGKCIARLTSNESKEWDEFVEATLFAYRTKKHKTTGYTPFYLMHGRQATLPIDLKLPGKEETDVSDNPLMERLYHLIEQVENDRQAVVQKVTQVQQKQKERYDQEGISEKLKIGDKVLVEKTWLKTNFSAKLEDKWIGPYFIHDVLKDNVYKLRNMDGRLVRNLVHGNRLKLYYEKQLDLLITL